MTLSYKLAGVAANLILIAGLISAKQAFAVTQLNIVWDDEFNQPDGSAPDPTKWSYDIGSGGWGNNELEYYTSRTNNARIVEWPVGHRSRPGELRRQQLHLGPAADQGHMVMDLRPHGGEHQNPARTGNLARFLDAGHPDNNPDSAEHCLPEQEDFHDGCDYFPGHAEDSLRLCDNGQRCCEDCQHHSEDCQRRFDGCQRRSLSPWKHRISSNHRF